MKTKNWIIILMVLHLTQLSAQQFPQFTQYMLNPFIINPAYAGTTEYFNIKSGYRDQWVGMPGSPQTFYITAHGHIGKELVSANEENSDSVVWHNGIGATMLRDQTGPTSFTKANITYAHDFLLSRRMRLSFAISGGVKQFGFDPSKALLNDGSVPVNAMSLTSTLPDINAGLLLYHTQYFVGLSVQNLIFNQFNKSAYGLDQKHYSNNNQFDQHIFLQAGYVFKVHDFYFIPSALLKIVPGVATPSLDINTKIRYSNYLWGGFNFRTGDAISLFIGALFYNRYEISYAYDYGTGSFSNSLNGSHEIILGFRVPTKRQGISGLDSW